MPPTAGSKTGFVYINELGTERFDNTSVIPEDEAKANHVNGSKDFSQQNHISSSKSNMSLRHQKNNTSFDSDKSKSVLSLSVGVQCNPSDVSTVMSQLNRSSSGDIIKTNSRTALISYAGNDDEEDDNDGSISSNVPQERYQNEHRNCKHQPHSRKSYGRPLRRVHPRYHLQSFGTNKSIHYSDPDFRLSKTFQNFQDEEDEDDDDDDDDVVPLIHSQYYLNPRKNKSEKHHYDCYHDELRQRYRVIQKYIYEISCN